MIAFILCLNLIILLAGANFCANNTKKISALEQNKVNLERA